MKKILMIIMLCFSLLIPFNTNAKITTITDNEDFATPNDYTFIPRFINGTTKLETSSNYNTSDSVFTNYRKAYKSKGYNSYWALYKNVGTWKQHVVDIKITIEDVVDTDLSKKCGTFGSDVGDTDIIALMFMTNNVGIDMRAECRETGVVAIYKVQFFDNQTGEELTDIKSVLTYTDIDADERILIDNENTKETIYYAPYAVEHLDVIDSSYNGKYTFFKGNLVWTCGPSGGGGGDTNCLHPDYKPENCYEQNCDGGYKAGMLITLNDGSFTVGWAGMGIIFSSPSYLRIADSHSLKTVDKEIVKPGDELNYKIEQYVPNQSTSQHYKLWKITDKLESILETTIDNIKVTSNEEDVTDKFNIAIENNVLTVTAKEDYLALDEFYDRTFYIDIKTKVSNDIKDTKEILNSAVLDVQYGNNSFSEDIPSNPVQTIIERKEEIVEVPNTAKFISIIIYIVGGIFIVSGIGIIFRMKKKASSN